MAHNNPMSEIDFGYLTMEEIKVMAVNDRLKKFEGNASRAAASLEIHMNSIPNILNRNEGNPESPAKAETKKMNDQHDQLSREGWGRDATTGHSVPTALTPVPGIENIAKETFEKSERKQKQREQEQRDREAAEAAAKKVPAPAAGKAAAKAK